MELEPNGPSARRRSAALAGHQGDLDAATAALRDPDGKVRATALGALERAGGLTDQVLAEARDDQDAVVRRRAAELGATHPAVALAPLLDDPEPLVVEAACWASGEREHQPEPGIVPVLGQVAGHHHDPLCREAAVAALGALGDPAGLPAILAATTDKPAVRRRAVLALAPFDGPDVEAALLRAREDRDLQVRQAAEDLLED